MLKFNEIYAYDENNTLYDYCEIKRILKEYKNELDKIVPKYLKKLNWKKKKKYKKNIKKNILIEEKIEEF